MRFLKTEGKSTMTFSNAPVEDYPTWDSSATYNTGDEVIYENNIWVSKEDSNQNNEPGTNTAWYKEGATNPYKCLDEYMNTQTVMDDDTPLIMEFDITNSNAMAFLNLEANKVVVTIYDADGNKIKTITKNTLIGVSDWEDYFFGEYENISKIMIEGVQLLKGKLKVEIYGYTNRPAKVGMVLIGFLEDLGVTLQGAKSSIDDYSKKNIDQNGNIYLKEGNYADRFEGQVLIDVNDFNKIKRRLTRLRGQAFYYIATEEDICRELDVYGFYENFEIDIDNPKKAQCSLTIRGLI